MNRRQLIRTLGHSIVGIVAVAAGVKVNPSTEIPETVVTVRLADSAIMDAFLRGWKANDKVRQTIRNDFQ